MTTTKPRHAVPKLRFPEFRSGDAWTVVRIGDACNVYQPETIPSSQFTPSGKHAVYGAGGPIGRLDRYNHATDEVIIGCRGICGNVSRTEPMSWITGNAMVISPKRDGLDKAFLLQLLTATDFAPIVSGSAQPQITRQALEPFRIAVPEPEEQQKIAACLTSVDDLISAEGRKLDALRRHKQGLVQQLFPQPGETVPRLRFPEFEDSPEWELRPLEVVCEILNNQRVPITSSDRRPGPYPYYGASGIVDYVDAYIFDERLVLVGEDGAKWGAFEPTAFIADGKYWVNNHAHVLRPHATNDILLASYLTMIDLSEFVTGAAPPKMTLGKLKAIPIPISPRDDEHEAIAGCLSAIDDRITAEGEKVEALKAHKKGLMQQLFPTPKEETR